MTKTKQTEDKNGNKDVFLTDIVNANKYLFSNDVNDLLIQFKHKICNFNTKLWRDRVGTCSYS